MKIIRTSSHMTGISFHVFCHDLSQYLKVTQLVMDITWISACALNEVPFGTHTSEHQSLESVPTGHSAK